MLITRVYVLFFFFFNDTATTEIYTLSLHDALPIFGLSVQGITGGDGVGEPDARLSRRQQLEQCALLSLATTSIQQDRKSTRLNSSHGYISYAVFCLKKKKLIICTVSIKCNRPKLVP